jgi:diguanylate cyclase (GGDEF)-like protein
VYNRREFQQQLKAEVERSRRYGRPCSLLMVDIDHFKSLNDTYGHQAGDEALRATAALIKREVRSGERVARP